MGNYYEDLISMEDLEVIPLSQELVEKSLKEQEKATGREVMPMFDTSNLKGLFYKDVLIFTTVSESLDEYSIRVLDETDSPMGKATIELRDNYDDLYYFGNFSSLQAVKEWLENPTLNNSICRDNKIISLNNAYRTE